MKYRVVTGFVPIPGHPRSAAEYAVHAVSLFDVIEPYTFFEDNMSQCWVNKLLSALPPERMPAPAVADNPAKNTLAYHAVQHQKFEWLARAAALDNESFAFVWIDYGILHVPGITATVIDQFCSRLAAMRPRKLACPTLPGCWNPVHVSDSYPCWRFCGGLMIVPRVDVHPLFEAARREVHKSVYGRNCLSWEVNTLARIENSGKLPLHWYSADHNASMFDNFR